MFNSFGNILRLTSFGESHGKGIGGVIDGFPVAIMLDPPQERKGNVTPVRGSRSTDPSTFRTV